MVLRKLLQGIALFLGLGSLNLASATSIQDWDGSLDRNEGSRELVEGNLESDEAYIPVLEDVAAVSPKRRGPVKMQRSKLAMVPFQPNSAKEIKDETATTGENAKKALLPLPLWERSPMRNANWWVRGMYP
jgi:hypothetical protein